VKISDIIRDGLRFCSAQVWRVEGREKESGALLSMLYSGPDTQYEYIRDRIFGDANVDKKFLRRLPVPMINKVLRSANCSLAVIAAPRWGLSIMEVPGDVCVPWWIDSEIDCQVVLGSGKTKGLQNDLRKIRKNNFHFTIANTAQDVEFFYKRIYRPTIDSSHGAAALPSSFQKKLKQFMSGKAELLFVMKDTERVGGVLIDFRDKLPVLRDIGVLDGAREFKNLGVMTAADYFGVEHLQSKGYLKVSMGLSRCFVDDGVFNYKQKWRPRFFGPSSGAFLFRVLKLDQASRAFFMFFDCIAESKGELRRTRFMHDGACDGGSNRHSKGPTEIRGISATQWYGLSGDIPLRCSEDSL